MFKRILEFIFPKVEPFTPKRNILADIKKAQEEGRFSPGEVGDPKDICKNYDSTHDGPTPCDYPYCRCTEGKSKGPDFVRTENLVKDAKRYRWLRDDNAYAPEEHLVRGGKDLDNLCDKGIKYSESKKKGIKYTAFGEDS